MGLPQAPNLATASSLNSLTKEPRASPGIPEGGPPLSPSSMVARFQLWLRTPRRWRRRSRRMAASRFRLRCALGFS